MTPKRYRPYTWTEFEVTPVICLERQRKTTQNPKTGWPGLGHYLNSGVLGYETVVVVFKMFCFL